jgi:hypothetical protein
MATRHIYPRIDDIAGYSPIEPSPHGDYRRDWMRNTGQEVATIPVSEVNARRLDALIYREYLDPDYLIPKPDKLAPPGPHLLFVLASGCAPSAGRWIHIA